MNFIASIDKIDKLFFTPLMPGGGSTFSQFTEDAQHAQCALRNVNLLNV